MTAREVDAVAAVLAAAPGSTAGEVRDRLRSQGMVSITTADVVRVLRAHPRRFAHDGADPARWWPVGEREAHEGVAVAQDQAVDSVGGGAHPDARPHGRGAGSSTGPTAAPPRAGPPAGPSPSTTVIEGGAPTGAGAVDERERDQTTRSVSSGVGIPALYAWQVEALDAWRRQGARGVVEAVTGTGKTMVGVVAARHELAAGGQVCVVVPTRELLAQWRDELGRLLPTSASVGLLGDGHGDSLGHHDVLVAVVNSARDGDLRPRRPGGLLVADECHRYGTAGNQLALEARFPKRLGLSATYARADDGHLAWLDPYFGPTCFRMGYRRAIADGVTARVNVALVGVRFSTDERAEYDEVSHVMRTGRARLIGRGLAPAEPIGVFLEAVARLARRGDDDEDAVVARGYLRAMQDRRRLLAETPAKSDLLAALVPAVDAADRAIVFTQSIVAAERASALLRALGTRAEAVHSGLATDQRRGVLERFAAGDLDVVAAPQVLDEGVDVPAADLAFVLAASRSRRQMVQRMGRVLRRKPDGRAARFLIAYVEDTVEDPAWGAHETFLDEVTAVADAVETFPSDRPRHDACTFLRQTHT